MSEQSGTFSPYLKMDYCIVMLASEPFTFNLAAPKPLSSVIQLPIIPSSLPSPRCLVKYFKFVFSCLDLRGNYFKLCNPSTSFLTEPVVLPSLLYPFPQMPSPGVLVKQEVKEEPPDSPVDQHDGLSPQHNDEDVFLSEVNNPVFV